MFSLYLPEPRTKSKGRFIIEYMKTKDLGDVAAKLQFLSHGDKLSQFRLGTNTSNVPNILIEYKLKGVNLDIESSRDICFPEPKLWLFVKCLLYLTCCKCIKK